MRFFVFFILFILAMSASCSSWAGPGTVRSDVHKPGGLAAQDASHELIKFTETLEEKLKTYLHGLKSEDWKKDFGDQILKVVESAKASVSRFKKQQTEMDNILAKAAQTQA